MTTPSLPATSKSPVTLRQTGAVVAPPAQKAAPEVARTKEVPRYLDFADFYEDTLGDGPASLLGLPVAPILGIVYGGIELFSPTKEVPVD